MNKLSFLARTSLLIAFFFLLDKVLAFVRVGIISRQYADSVHLLDTFNAANNLPDVLFALGGVLTFGVICYGFMKLLMADRPLHQLQKLLARGGVRLKTALNHRT